MPFSADVELEDKPITEEWKKDVLKEAAKDLTDTLNGSSKKTVPKDTGLLRRTLRARQKGIYVEIWGQFYGRILHYRSRHSGWITRWIHRAVGL